MKTHPLLFAAGLLALFTVSAQARIDRVVEKTFNVQPGGLLTVETQGGSIRVDTADTSKVTVVAKQRIKASSEREADELLEKLSLTIEEVSNGVSAKAKYERMGWGSNPVQVDFVVTIPARYDVALQTSGGDVKIGDLDGEVRARTSGGNVSIGKVTKHVKANTSGGNISLDEGHGEVRLDTSGGNIRVQRVVGMTELDTSGGDIAIESVEGSVDADTSGGNVTAGIRGALKGDCSLSTSGGRVKATVDRDIGFNLDASTSGGRVSADGLTITIDKGGAGRSKLSGRVNGGGPALRLRSSGGDVVIETR